MRHFKDNIKFLSYFFSSSSLWELIKKESSTKFGKILVQLKESKLFSDMPFEKIKYVELYKVIYDYMKTNYQYSYIYKSQYFIKAYPEILSGNIKFYTEYPIYSKGVEGNFYKSNVVDILIVSQTYTHSIEIKSQFDSYSRLKNQLTVSLSIFKYVSVMCSDSTVDNLVTYLKKIDLYSYVGIFTMNGAGIICQHKKPVFSIELKEKSTIIYNSFHNLSPNSSIEELLEVYRESYFNQDSYRLNFLHNIPDCLKLLVYGKKEISERDYSRLINKLERKIILK